MKMRIEFEDKGQDILWWELDGDSGEITDCGPYHAELYADGEHFVELESIILWCRPFYYDSAEFKEQKMGDYLRYAVVKIESVEVS